MTKQERQHEWKMRVGYTLACIEANGEPVPKVIPLSQGQYMLIDEDDFDRLNRRKWCAHWAPSNKSYYAKRAAKDPVTGGQLTLYANRVVLGLPYRNTNGYEGDHINHNTLDNRKSNLRIVSKRENKENSKRINPFGAGVRKDNRNNKKNPFYVKVHMDGNLIHVGSFATAEEARKARQRFLQGKRQSITISKKDS